MSMSTRSFDIADFYQQLALLIRSNLPLPESLHQLAKHFPRHDFQEALTKIADETSRGRNLSDALAAYPHFFGPLERRLLAASENSNTLPEVLAEVAKLARVQGLVVGYLRDIMQHPALTVHVAVLIVFFFSFRILPIYDELFHDLLGGWYRLPWLTEQVMKVGDFVRRFWLPLAVLYVGFVGLSLAVSLPNDFSRRVLLRVARCVPGGKGIARLLDMARLCNVSSVFVRQNMPLHEAFAASATLMEHSGLGGALERTARGIQEGQAAVILVQNVVERAGAEKSVSADRLRTVLQEEFAASRFGNDAAARLVCEPTREGALRIGVRHDRSGNLVSVEVGP